MKTITIKTKVESNSNEDEMLIKAFENLETGNFTYEVEE